MMGTWMELTASGCRHGPFHTHHVQGLVGPGLVGSGFVGPGLLHAQGLAQGLVGPGHRECRSTLRMPAIIVGTFRMAASTLTTVRMAASTLLGTMRMAASTLLGTVVARIDTRSRISICNICCDVIYVVFVLVVCIYLDQDVLWSFYLFAFISIRMCSVARQDGQEVFAVPGHSFNYLMSICCVRSSCLHFSRSGCAVLVLFVCICLDQDVLRCSKGTGKFQTFKDMQ